MTDRVYPSKPTANGGVNPAFPANKAQLYKATRPPYRPQPPPRRRSGRSLCCTCCLGTTLLILLVLLLAAIAGAVFYVIYRPHRPSFSVASLRLSRFNLTDTAVTSAFNVTILANNHNSKIIFLFERISVRLLSGDVDVGSGDFPAFTQGKKNVTTLRAVVSNSNTPISAGTDISPLRSGVRRRNLPIRIRLDTEVRAKIGNIKTKKLKIRVICDGIGVSIPNGKTTSVATISKEKCKVDPRIKIIRWTL
ncbi:Late embryogenesis abundant (LEA) hydroxyproline-rich glycoprotein family [Striga hermonthica]|uniref:Late embryogenesis abundant (LEA) hydroxyproline-rich glycoprotein family n=1 Tax=Striga hermonthica TaxID=68872 RepID=A0A9N7N3S1_STRHE|nr:Late embryogenesis abundant (LEA) hydroxyproline-rich glycoprotein family [Striga hermonthica]